VTFTNTDGLSGLVKNLKCAVTGYGTGNTSTRAMEGDAALTIPAAAT
jgi:hypothetical protein